MKSNMLGTALLILSACACVSAAGCSSSQDSDKTRQQASDATNQVRQESKQVAEQIKKGAIEAGQQGKAIVEGAREGFAADTKKVNVNSASRQQLLTLPGMDEDSAQRIIAGRPYHTKDELNTKGIVSPEEFQKIQGQISAN